MEVGNRSFDQRVPEEINRRIVDHIADINLTYSTIAREYLLREGLLPDQVIKTGSPMFEVLHHYMPQIETSDALDRLGLNTFEYFVVSAHREENIDSEKNFAKLHGCSVRWPKTTTFPWWSLPILVHACVSRRRKTSFHPKVQLLKPLGFHDYVNLQMNAKAVLSDSGTITEESRS